MKKKRRRKSRWSKADIIALLALLTDLIFRLIDHLT